MNNKKGDVTSISTNTIDLLSGNQIGVLAFKYNARTLEKQLLSSGAVEKLAVELTDHLRQHRTIKIRTSCKHCKRPFAQQKLVSDLMLCQDCLTDARSAPLPKRNRILAEVIKNYTAAFQRRICMGGQHV